MSNILPSGSAGEVASVGSFAIARSEPMFTPWGSSDIDGADAVAGDGDIESIRADAFAQGWDQGRRTVELEFAAERDALMRLAESLEALQPEPTNALALLLAETVHRLVGQIVGSVPVDSTLLQARAEAAAAMIGSETEPARLRLNPQDIALFEGGRLPVPLLADPALERGALVLETGQGWIEDGPAVRLERLRAELDRIGAAR